MTIILEQYDLPKHGTFEIRQTVTIHFSAEEARRKVDRWLRMDIGHMLGADDPTLSIGTQTTWHVPVHFSVPHIGIVGQVGDVKIDALTGEILDLEIEQAKIVQNADRLATTLPPYQPHTDVPAESVPTDVPSAPWLVLNEHDEPIFVSSLSV